MDIKWIKNKIKKECAFFIFLLISALLHFSSYINLKNFAFLENDKQKKMDPFKVKADDTGEVAKLVEEAKRLYEARQKPNEKPKDADHLGFQNHSTDKEQRVDTKFNTPMLDASSRLNRLQGGQKSSGSDEIQADNSSTKDKNKNKQQKLGKLYKKFMPALNDNNFAVGSGKQDTHVDELDSKLGQGEYTDVNTLEYKNMGYFVSMRKAVEAVWVYPSEARRFRYQGVVGIKFNLEKDGSVTEPKVLKSSGYQVLDVYALKALEEASFFPPPKEVYEKSPFYWTFSYQIY